MLDMGKSGSEEGGAGLGVCFGEAMPFSSWVETKRKTGAQKRVPFFEGTPSG